MSTPAIYTILNDGLLTELKKEAKDKGLNRKDTQDFIFTKCLDRLSLQGRLMMMYYCAMNDSLKRTGN